MFQPIYSIISRSSAYRNCLIEYSSRPLLISELKQSLPSRAISGVASKYRRAKDDIKKKKKRPKQQFRNYDKKDLLQFSLCDAMRYIRAFEAGQMPNSVKYDLAVRFATTKSSPVIRSHIRFPHPPDNTRRICVICKPDSKVAASAKACGATLVGEENVFETVRSGNIEFDSCICHLDSLAALTDSGIARILGPKQLMPSVKTGTIVRDIAAAIKEMAVSSVYRERAGVVRIAVGQLGYGPEELQRNIKAIMSKLQSDAGSLKGKSKTTKELEEVVLSSTHSPGFSLDGNFSGPQSVPVAELST